MEKLRVFQSFLERWEAIRDPWSSGCTERHQHIRPVQGGQRGAMQLAIAPTVAHTVCGGLYKRLIWLRTMGPVQGTVIERNPVGLVGAPSSEQLLFASPNEALRFLPGGRAFQRRTRLVNSLLGGWPIVFGSGSWLEAHLVARLALASRQPNLRGCGITEQEVWDLVQQELEQGNLRSPLVVICDSLAADQGRALTRRLLSSSEALQIILLVQNDQWLTAASLADCKAQAIVHGESFGTGVVIRALQALRRRQTFVDPRLLERLNVTAAVQLNGRERQVLQGLVRGLSNKQIAEEAEIATTTVRDYVSRLCRRLGAANRTQVVSRAIALGLAQPRR